MKKLLAMIFIYSLIFGFISGCTEDETISEVDIDLTELSMTMIEAEYQRIITNAEDNIGKTIRTYGSYRTLIIDNAGNYLHFIVVVPGDECCWLGFEFIRDGDYNFPDDYPAQNSAILITGTLDKYTDSGSSFLFIAVDDLSVNNS